MLRKKADIRQRTTFAALFQLQTQYELAASRENYETKIKRAARLVNVVTCIARNEGPQALISGLRSGQASCPPTPQ